ncbi:MAG TPA: epimerase [Pseudonocardiaceae bacterium]|jgi:uncharacterized protein YbjT (DUF2867 family)|nr:epimerase [Pseudonocardiaceae bacterium]
MKVILFGGTGMVGQGVLLECLREPNVERVLSIGRTPLGRGDPKLTEIVQPDVADLAPVADRLDGYDACFFCLGVSSTGMSEADYRRLTYDLTLSVARLLAERNPDMTFVYVSGQGTDSSERGRFMWARVKGATENALLALPLRTYLFRPGFIQPAPGVTPKVAMYARIYRLVRPITPLLLRLFPRFTTTSEAVGRAMIAVAGHGHPRRVLENRDLNTFTP